jgi:hypothetical protein
VPTIAKVTAKVLNFADVANDEAAGAALVVVVDALMNRTPGYC